MIELEPSYLTLATLSSLLAVLHVIFPSIDRRIRRHEATSIGLIGGVAAGYVVLYMLPKIADMNAAPGGDSATVPREMYYMLLGSIVVYLTMIHVDQTSRSLSRISSAFDALVHGSYSVLIGYVFVELSSANVVTNTLIVLILGCHLLGMDHLLRASRTHAFDRYLRWIFCLLVLAGTLTGIVTEFPPFALKTITAFVGGIILVNVIAEELPVHHQERLPWFVVGVAGYVGLTYLIVILD